MGQNNLPSLEKIRDECPFKPKASMKCHHRLASRVHGKNGQTPSCGYAHNQSLCPLFNAWKRDREAIERMNNTISNNASRL